MKSILIEDSILFYLIYKNSLKNQIIEILIDWIQHHNIVVSDIYAFFKIYQIFDKSNKIKEFFEFYHTCNEFITTIYPIDNKIYKNALTNSILHQINFDLIVHVELMKETNIQYLFSFNSTQKESEIIKQYYSIEIIRI